MKQEHLLLGIAGIAAVVSIYFLTRASKPNGENGNGEPLEPVVAFVPSTIPRGDPVAVVWDNFDDGVLGIGSLYTSWGYRVYTYESYDGSGSIEFSGSLTGSLMQGEYRLVVEQESVSKIAEAYLTVI